MKLRSAKFLSLVLVALVLTACADTRPYIWGATILQKNEVGNKVEIIPGVVMVCYNAEFHDPKTVTALAVEECGLTKRTARFIKQDVLACPVFLPARAHFECIGEPVITKRERRKSTVPAEKDAGPNVVEPVEPPKLPDHFNK